MLQVNNLTKRYGEQIVFEKLSFSLNERDRIGFLGRNGSGKSTLFRIILGIEEQDDGDVKIPNGYTIASLDQTIKFTEKTTVDECCLVLKDPILDRYKAEKILFGLGLEKDDLLKDPNSFSGGF